MDCYVLGDVVDEGGCDVQLEQGGDCWLGCYGDCMW